MRKLGIAALCILLICIGLLLYTEYDNLRIKESLPAPVLDTSASKVGTERAKTPSDPERSAEQRSA